MEVHLEPSRSSQAELLTQAGKTMHRLLRLKSGMAVAGIVRVISFRLEPFSVGAARFAII